MTTIPGSLTGSRDTKVGPLLKDKHWLTGVTRGKPYLHDVHGQSHLATVRTGDDVLIEDQPDLSRRRVWGEAALVYVTD